MAARGSRADDVHVTDTQHHRCTDCGYALDSLDPRDGCPECGRPVASSMPGARSGSCWQRGRFFGGAVESLVRPKGVWEDVRPERPWNAFALLVIGCALASVPMGLSLALATGTHASHWSYGPRFSLVMWGVLVCLCLTEACGFAFIAWRRGWSRSVGHVMSAVAHGAPVWIVAGVLGGLAWQVVTQWDALWRVRPLVVQGQTVLPEGWIVWGVMVGAFGVGMVCYEASAYYGMTRLRYTSRG
jgi:hypothetical protein